MILGLEDIPGGTPLFSFFIWLALSGLFYLSCYVAVLNVLDDITRNSLLKIPAMIGATNAPIRPIPPGASYRPQPLTARPSQTQPTSRAYPAGILIGKNASRNCAW